MGKKYYITTPLYYVNSPLTIGGAYTTIVADVLARYQRLRGKEVFFLTGSDEHGQKIKKAAEEEGISPQELADRVVGTFLELWEMLEITNDDFIRTTEPRHEKVVEEVFRRLVKKGDIYWGSYEGWYCTPCETFLLDSQLSEGLCPQCGRPVEKLVEDNYFFRFSRYQKLLEEHFRNNPDFVRPPSRYREMLNRLKEGLNDISVSRAISWGVPVPGKEEQGIWVWFDALLNYISAPNSLTPGGEEEIWPADIHLMAKDIVWFHSLLWPAMLMALDLPLPRTVYAHGWWTMGGEKISKSKGAAYARDVVEEFGPDPLRYFMLREIPLGLDGDFSFEALAVRYRSDLANDLGNLLQRSLSMIKKYRKGRLPASGEDPAGKVILEEIASFWPRYHREMEDLKFSQVLEGIWSFIHRANRYIEESKPWRLYREDRESGRLDGVLFTLVAILLHSASWVQPFMPGTAEKICRQIQPSSPIVPAFSQAEANPSGVVRSGQLIGKIEPLFPILFSEKKE
ncbi:MAG: methionine--tRNA ligase [Candidatus Euphemobacter frigidus]|nr:methionine--tRNA ligase [Candidatus Euphemobacter frigidus]MDP8275653.1 methionine--tRNA ligase [Candidatus Euphemobacter frigidus]